MPAYYGNFVVPPLLAEEADLVAYTGGSAPVNVNVLLRSATTLVLQATRGAYYPVDPTTGLSTDDQIAGALNLATVIQAAAWSALGYDPLTGGVLTTSVASSTKIDTASEQFADAQLAAAARAAAITDLVPEAERVLELNNLLMPNPWTFG